MIHRFLLAAFATLFFATPIMAEIIKTGDMRKMMFHSTPKNIPTVTFETETTQTKTLQDFAGEYTLVNLWATWCAPCRAEMPTLSNLQNKMENKNLTVITIAIGRNPLPAIKTFFDDINVDNLPLYRDPNSQLARQMGVFGLPVTILISPDGKEIARLQGDAEWDTKDALDLFEAIGIQDKTNPESEEHNNKQ